MRATLPSAVALALFAVPLRAADPVDYLRDVKPLLAARCGACHGALQQKAGLRLDTAKSVRDGGDSGPSADAYEKVVERLLASPQYGERWGRHWMDVWRYSDWWGLGAEVRNSQKHVWHWRDWIVESLNADKGYDQMVREMLAADELYPTDPGRLRATGFLARQYFIFNRTTWLDETIEHTGKGFLALTLNCARCHDHKYDPF